jgi:hypothetical protein
LNVHFTGTFIPSQFIGTVKRVRHIVRLLDGEGAATPQDEARDKLTVAHCLSIACSNFEKHAYCLGAKGTSPPGSMFALSPIILQIRKIERLNGAALITRSMRR